MPHNKTSEWRLNGHYEYSNIVGYEQYFCLVHQDTNIISIYRGARDLIRKAVMKKLCNDIICNKDDGDIKTLPPLTLYF